MKKAEYDLNKTSDGGTTIEGVSASYCINDQANIELTGEVIIVHAGKIGDFIFTSENTTINDVKYDSAKLLFAAMVSNKLFR